MDKACSRCGDRKALAEFRVYGKGARQGRHLALCRACEREQSTSYRIANPEKRQATEKRYQAKHPEQVKQWARDNYARHAESRIAKVREYQQANAEQARAWKRKYSKTPRGKTVNLLKEHRRRAMKRGAALADPIPPDVVYRLFAAFGGKCAWGCGRLAKVIDHVMPLAKGGHHAADNLVPSCALCNGKKSAKPPEEWAKLAGVSLTEVLAKAKLFSTDAKAS